MSGSRPPKKKPAPKDGRTSRSQLLLVLVLLLAAVVAVTALKHGLVERYGVYNQADAVGSFWTETAFHFRHARMVAEGEGIPALDRQAQWPEGIDIWRYCTPLMDWTLGTLWRHGVGRQLPFHQFVISSQLLFSSVSVVAVFIGAFALWRRPWAALLAALLHGFSLSHVERCALYLRESFALPFLWLWLALLLAALRSSSRRSVTLLASASALCFVLALASWHVARFEALIVVVALALTQLPRTGLEALEDPRTESLRRTLTILASVGALASLALPVLRASAFLVSPAMTLLYGLLACLCLLPRLPPLGGRAFRPACVALLAACFVAGSFLERAFGGYSHVSAIVKAKLMMLGSLPDDPLRISFEARSMWTGPFHGPDASFVLAIALPVLLGATVVAALVAPGFLRRQENRLPAFLFAVVGAGTVAFFLASRFHVLLHAPAAMLAAGLVGACPPRWRPLGFAGLAALVGLSLTGLPWSQPLPLQQPAPEQVRALTDYLRNETPPDAVIACEYQWGPSILLDAQRAVIVQSKWENPTIRPKVEAFQGALTGSLEELASFLRGQGVTHLVLTPAVTLNATKDSALYWSGKTELRKDMAAYRLHFASERIGTFRPVFENELHRVFALHAASGAPPESPAGAGLPKARYWPQWDEAALGLDRVSGPVVPREAVERAQRIAADPVAWVQVAVGLQRAGRTVEAEDLLLRAAEPALSSAEAASGAGHPNARAIAEVSLAGGRQAAIILARRGDSVRAVALLERSAALASALGDAAKARELLAMASSLDR